jgi:hypothetical protein
MVFYSAVLGYCPLKTSQPTRMSQLFISTLFCNVGKRLQYRRLNPGPVTISSAFKGIRLSVSKETNCWEILSD